MIVALAFVLGVCVAGGDGSPTADRHALSAPSTASATTSDHVFELHVSTSDTQPAANSAITIETTVKYVGPEPVVTVSGAAGGLVAFELEDVEAGRSVGPVMDAACKRGTMTQGRAVSVPFVKSGGYSEDDPNDDLARWYLADPVLRLPTGHWRVVAHLTAYVGDCAAHGAHELSAGVEVVIQP